MLLLIHAKVGKMWYIGDWPDTLDKSPYVWYSTCLTFDAFTFTASLSLNGISTYEISDRVHLENTQLIMDSPIQVFCLSFFDKNIKIRIQSN